MNQRVGYGGLKPVRTAGGPDCLSIGAAKPQEGIGLDSDSSCAYGTPIAELSRPPAPCRRRQLPAILFFVTCSGRQAGAARPLRRRERP